MRHAPTKAKGWQRSVLFRLLQLAAPFTGWMILAALMGFATIASGIGLMTTSGYLIARAAQRPSIADLQIAIVGVRFFGIARGAFRYLERIVSHDVTFRLLASMRTWFYRRLEPLAPARLCQYRTGDLLARSVADIETLQDFFLRVIAPPSVATLIAGGTALLVGLFHAWLGALLLLFLSLVGVGLPLLTHNMARTTGQRMVRVRSTLNAVLVDGIQGVADLLAFGGEEQHLAEVDRLSHEMGSLQGHMARIDGLQAGLVGLLVNIATIALLLVAIPLAGGGQLDSVYLALLVLAVVASFEAVLPLPQAFQLLEHSLAAARRLFEIVDTEPAVAEVTGGSRVPDSPYIRVQHLRFAYSAEAAPALDDVSFDLPPRGMLAVVGPSGAGKSTLLRLLARFWEFSEGQILLNGRDLREFSAKDLRRRVTVMSQHTYLFNATIRENLLLARPDASEDELHQAAAQAQLHEFVQSLPQGYDTWIGEQGLRLSGGQRQRLTIARAVLKDAPILLLDEPTANLDSLTEREVVAALRTIAADRTVLLVSHRLVGLVQSADEILVLRSAKIVERGTHQDLVQMGGLYRRMWDLQNQMLIESPSSDG